MPEPACTTVTATALDGGIVRLRYGDAPASWVVGDVAEGATDMHVAIDEACRVRVTLADGTVAVDDVQPFADGTLVRTALADRVYGLGERIGGLDRRGRRWTFWNTDAYDPAYGGWKPDQDPLYQAIPLEVHFADGKAFGLFTDVARRMTIDLGGAVDRTTTTGGITQYVIPGPTLADVLDRYTQLTGRPALPPRWALGFHQSRWGYPDAATVEAVAQRFRDEDIPADAMWLDIQHMDGFRSFTFDPQHYGDPAGLVARLAAKGFRTIAIEDPGIKVDPGWDVYDSGTPYFLPYTGRGWAGDSRWPDMSSPGARAWWAQQITRVLDLGIAGIWLDVNEPTTFPEGGGGTTIPDDVAGAGGTMAELHNVYGLLEARATYEAIAAHAPSARPFVLSRAGYAGIQRYAAVWTGDTPSTWDGLAQTLPMMLGMGLSGVPVIGSDIGGYSGGASAELYARWLALGSISPFARAHVTADVPGQEPWMFDDAVTDAARAWLTERYRLMPYLVSLAYQASQTGAPILRPLVWEFPDDAATYDLADEAMLGPYLLVAPAVAEGATSRAVYLPAGRWFEWGTDRVFDGPTTIEVSLRTPALPMFAREGAIIPATDVVEVFGAGSFTRFDDPGTTTITFDGTTLSPPLPARVHVPGDAMVDVTFEVHVPGQGAVYLAASSNGWQHAAMTQVAPGVWQLTVTAPRGAWIDYKYTRGSWDTVEKAADCRERPDRARLAGPRTQLDRVRAWRDACP